MSFFGLSIATHDFGDLSAIDLMERVQSCWLIEPSCGAEFQMVQSCYPDLDLVVVELVQMVQMVQMALVVELSPAGPSGRLALARSGEQNSVKPPAGAGEPQLDRRV